MSLDRLNHPVPFCRCDPCRAGSTRVWRRLSSAARRALDALDRRIARDPGDLRRFARVGFPTLHALTVSNAYHPALAECVPLVEAGLCHPQKPLAYYRLTPAGVLLRAHGRALSKPRKTA